MMFRNPNKAAIEMSDRQMNQQAGNASEQAVVSQALAEGQGGISNFIENNLELAKWTADPDAKIKWSHLNKDLTLSNLTEKDVILLKEHFDLARELNDAGMASLAMEHIEMATEITTTSQGRAGFRSRLMSAPERGVRIIREQKGPKKGWLK